MSSNLSPGVTQGMIDRYFAGPCEDCVEGRHEVCEDSECTCATCQDGALEDYYESLAEERRLEQRFGAS